MSRWGKPRTVFATLFYCACIYMCIIGKIEAKFLEGVVMILLGHYFGTKTKEK